MNSVNSSSYTNNHPHSNTVYHIWRDISIIWRDNNMIIYMSFFRTGDALDTVKEVRICLPEIAVTSARDLIICYSMRLFHLFDEAVAVTLLVHHFIARCVEDKIFGLRRERVCKVQRRGALKCFFERALVRTECGVESSRQVGPFSLFCVLLYFPVSCFIRSDAFNQMLCF